MIKQFAVSAMIAAAVILPASAASATVDPEECSNFGSPIIISNGYDPLHLDTDGDGIACRSNPGEPVKTDLYADLRGEDTVSPSPTAVPTTPAPSSASPSDSELAKTGATDLIHRHPVRAIGIGVLGCVVGLGFYVTGRRMQRAGR